jgi:hypothetical protein
MTGKTGPRFLRHKSQKEQQMKKLLVTTALVTALATGVSAQTNNQGMIVPEGYTEFNDFNLLTFDRLTGANVYDVNGDSIGQISDIVLDAQPAGGQASASAQPGQLDGQTDQGGVQVTTNQEGGVTQTDTMVNGEGVTAMQSTDPVATEGLQQGAATDAQTNQTDVDTGTVVTNVDTTATGTGTGAVDQTAQEAQAEIAETANQAIEDINQTANQTTDGTTGTMGGTLNADGVMVDAQGMPVDQGMNETGQQLTMSGGSGISHVIIDIGGFLGIGVHTVALPMEALEIYAGANNDLRIYVPWSEAQLRDLRQYDANDPTTLGTMGN